MSFYHFLRNHILPYWRSYVVVLLPILLLPLPILLTFEDDLGVVHREALAGYVILIMALYWMTEALPLAITSLIPVVFFPLFGIMDTSSVTMAYMRETNMMFIGGLIVALSIEYCNLHKRIALRVLTWVGASPRWLMAGFMGVTMFLSMWISNTATTAMMVPIVEAVVQELFRTHGSAQQEDSESSSSGTSSVTNDLKSGSKEELPSVNDSQQDLVVTEEGRSAQECSPKEENRLSKIRTGILMSVAYSSNLGGTGTIIGSGTQLAFKGIFNSLFPQQNVMNFATWMAFNIPAMLINLVLAWLWLQFLFIGFKKTNNEAVEKQVKNLLRKKYRDLGPITFHEAAILLLFVTVVLLWFFRDPQFIDGWAELIHAAEVDDSSAAMAVVLLLFIIPATPNFWCLRKKGGELPEKPSQALLHWQYVQDRLPWGIVLLLGGGFALSDASKSSGLSSWLGKQLTGLEALHPFVIMLIICIMTAAVTEVASNTATANIVLPIIAEMSVELKYHPLYLMLPATVTCSYAFMLPVATPPNAIVFTAAKMKPVQLIKAGFLMNIVCVLIICTMMQFYGAYLFNTDEFPDWAIPTDPNTTPTVCVQTTESYTTLA